MNVLRALSATLLLTGIGWTIAQDGGPMFQTHKVPGTKPGIVRHRQPSDLSVSYTKLKAIPKFDPNSESPFQVDLRSQNLTDLDVTGSEADLCRSLFDSKTKWPAAVGKMKRFKPDDFMRLGKDPGLGIRELHKQGITGKGVSIAIIDQGLLVDHVEYKDRVRMYEEIHCSDEPSIHGPAVASIAVGKNVGVAPGADLYYIAEYHMDIDASNKPVVNLKPAAQSIDRLLEINRDLPKERKIRVISFSFGGQYNGYTGQEEMLAAIGHAKKAGIFFVSCAPYGDYRELGFNYIGLGREPAKDPNKPQSFGLAGFVATEAARQAEDPEAMSRMVPKGVLYVPMDSRCTASVTGFNDYAFYREGGMSWCAPWMAGLYALACQVKPDVTPAEFVKAAMATGDIMKTTFDGHPCTLDRVVNPKKLMAKLKSKAK